MLKARAHWFLLVVLTLSVMAVTSTLTPTPVSAQSYWTDQTPGSTDAGDPDNPGIGKTSTLPGYQPPTSSPRTSWGYVDLYGGANSYETADASPWSWIAVRSWFSHAIGLIRIRMGW